jgi:hypothetical protein
MEIKPHTEGLKILPDGRFHGIGQMGGEPYTQGFAMVADPQNRAWLITKREVSGFLSKKTYCSKYAVNMRKRYK